MATVVLVWTLGASVLLLFAAWCDLATRTIPDGVSIALAGVGVLGRALETPVGAVASLAVAAALFAALVVLHARGAFGGGDVKLMTALAVGFPPFATLDFLLATVLAGGALGVVYLGLRLLPRPSSPLAPRPDAWRPRRVLSLERRRFNRRGPLPYAVAIAAGGIFTLIEPFGG